MSRNIIDYHIDEYRLKKLIYKFYKMHEEVTCEMGKKDIVI